MALEIPRVKLVHKVLLLVAVPLIFQCLFVVTLESLWQQSRDHRRASDRSARILVRGYKLLSSLKQAEIYRRFGVNDEVQKLNAAAKVELTELTSQLEDTGPHREHVSVLTPFKTLELELAELNIKKLVDSDRYREQLSALKPFTNLDDITGGANASLQNLLTSFMTREEGSITLYRETFKQMERSIHLLMALGLPVNLVVCFFLMLYFTQNVLSRLRTIVANSERFTRGEELLPPPQGDDEINHLDRVFRQMTNSITKSRQREHQFLGMVSHDLRTPLNTVLATLNSLYEGVYGELTESGEQRVKQAEGAVERLTRLANDLLDLEKLSSGAVLLSLEPVSLQLAVKRACDSVVGFSDYKNVAILVPQTDHYVLADEEKLVQVFINLLSNAIKFSPDGAAVNIEFREFGVSAIEIRIADSGCGIAYDEQKSIFEPFKQASNQSANENATCLKVHGGSGLGLAICKTIIEAHGGSIGLESKPGLGSVFFIRLRLIHSPVSTVH